MSKEITEERYKRLKKQVEESRDEANRVEGALNSLMKRLKNEFGCESIKDAKSELKKLEEKMDKAEKEFESLLNEYEKRWHAK